MAEEGTIVELLKAIRAQESDGRYDIIGDRNLKHPAYGAYQLQARNLPRGTNIDEFLKTPEMQDTIARDHLMNLLKQAGSDPATLAAAWNAGARGATELGRGKKYAQEVLARMPKEPQPRAAPVYPVDIATDSDLSPKAEKGDAAIIRGGASLDTLTPGNITMTDRPKRVYNRNVSSEDRASTISPTKRAVTIGSPASQDEYQRPGINELLRAIGIGSSHIEYPEGSTIHTRDPKTGEVLKLTPEQYLESERSKGGVHPQVKRPEHSIRPDIGPILDKFPWQEMEDEELAQEAPKDWWDFSPKQAEILQELGMRIASGGNLFGKNFGKHGAEILGGTREALKKSAAAKASAALAAQKSLNESISAQADMIKAVASQGNKKDIIKAVAESLKGNLTYESLDDAAKDKYVQNQADRFFRIAGGMGAQAEVPNIKIKPQ